MRSHHPTLDSWHGWANLHQFGGELAPLNSYVDKVFSHLREFISVVPEASKPGPKVWDQIVEGTTYYVWKTGVCAVLCFATFAFTVSHALKHNAARPLMRADACGQRGGCESNRAAGAASPGAQAGRDGRGLDRQG